MHRYLQAIIYQSSAPLLLLCLSVTISRLLGPAEQGAFVSAKSWLDVLVALGCFGFPQSIVIAINRLGASRKYLYILTCINALVLFPLLTFATILFGSNLASTLLQQVMFAFGATCFVIINIWRSIILTLDDGLRFHFITVLPSLALIVAVTTDLILGYQLAQSMPHVFFLSGLITLLLGYTLCPWRLIRGIEGKPPKLKQLFLNGSDVFIQTVSGVLQVFICLAWLRHHYGLEEVGYFGVALMIMNAFGFPLQALSPMILNRWSKQDENLALNSGRHIVLRLMTYLVCACLLIIFVVPSVLPLILGHSFTSAVTGVQIMVACIIPMLFLRISSLRLTATGNFRLNSLIAAGRCVLLIILLHILPFMLTNLKGASMAALCWLMAETTAVLVTQHKILAIRKSI